jgi:phosphoglycerate dehydrogenase-like enzyme
MSSAIVVHPDFDRIWPFAADHFHHLWQAQGEVTFLRLNHEDIRPLGEILPRPQRVTRLVCLNVPVMTPPCVSLLPALREAVFTPRLPEELQEALRTAGVRLYSHPTEGFWGQSVAEFGLALTLCGLRRIPQTHHAILTDQAPWNYSPPGNRGQPGARGQQFGDEPHFINGTVEGKRVRIVGAGNIASRYASFVHMLGAEVAAWDPFASEPCFHRSGARKEWHLDQLVKDAEIFVPMVPLTEQTRGIVTAAHIEALPQGCLVVLVTRASICDMPTLRRRVMADELSLAADVWDVEPLPLDDPLLGRHNVVHTPHNAGRTRDANRQWAEKLAAQFDPVGG